MIKDKNIFNCSIGKRYPKEHFELKKFGRGFNILNPIWWSKALSDFFKVLIICGIIFGLIFSWGYINGTRNKPIKIDIGYGKEAIIEINEVGDHLYIDKKGFVYVRDKNENILKQVSVKDIPGLKKKLAPVGFQLKPIGVIGAGFGLEGGAFEGGAGISFLRYWKMELETFLTNRGIYIGSSYKITDNSNVGLGVGKGYKGDNRMILYYRWKF